MNNCDIKSIQSKQRKYIALSWVILILLSFWFLTPYPDLIAEYWRAKEQTLVDRSLGALSKDQWLDISATKSNPVVALKTWINWLDTNKFGMAFGIIFSAAMLLLFEQSRSLMRLGAKGGFAGIFAGTLIGTPMGVCTNCASPTINPIALLMLFTLFPVWLGMLRVTIIFGFLLLLLPLLIKMTAGSYQGFPLQERTIDPLNEP